MEVQNRNNLIMAQNQKLKKEIVDLESDSVP